MWNSLKQKICYEILFIGKIISYEILFIGKIISYKIKKNKHKCKLKKKHILETKNVKKYDQSILGWKLFRYCLHHWVFYKHLL